MKKLNAKIFWIIIMVGVIGSMILSGLCKWFSVRFTIGIEEIFFTINSPLNGSDTSFLKEAFSYILPALGCGILLITFLFIIENLLKQRFFQKMEWCYGIWRVICLGGTIVFFLVSVYRCFSGLQVGKYIANKFDKTTIYEDYYVDPDGTKIITKQPTKNLIYIYLESMENTYASIEAGGIQEINYIPNLTSLAEKNISFSDSDLLGGACTTPGTAWTMGALFSTTAGVPFAFPVQGNSMNNFENFAPGITTLGDILNGFGYKQIFLCGSDGEFAGRKKYFEQHGNYEVLDYYYAQEKGYISKDYYVWWGYEDAKLYEIAKKELLSIANNEEPFNFTMLTVDTHHVDGYVCGICDNTYDNQLANVLTCADKQVLDFITWCQEQTFYEDTVIVITGDHGRMDSTLVAGAEKRQIYNCILNAEKEPVLGTKHRIFTIQDFFPTTLSAMGFEIENNRLGLGTDLFSGDKTLAETLGIEVLREELSKTSDYYLVNFQDINTP